MNTESGEGSDKTSETASSGSRGDRQRWTGLAVHSNENPNWFPSWLATVEVTFPGKGSRRKGLRHDVRECEACGELALVRRGNKPTCRVCGKGKLIRGLGDSERKEGRMKVPKRQVEGTRKDIRVADLVDQLIAVRLVALGECTTKYSEGNVVPHADVRIFDVLGGTYIGETRVFQTYLVEQFAEADDDWVVGRIIKGERAYLLDAPDESELADCEKFVAGLGGVAKGEEPF